MHGSFVVYEGALDKQKEMYEQKLEELRREKTSSSLAPADTPPFDGRTSSGYVSTFSSLSDERQLGTPSSFYDRSVSGQSHILFWGIICCIQHHGSQTAISDIFQLTGMECCRWY